LSSIKNTIFLWQVVKARKMMMSLKLGDPTHEVRQWDPVEGTL